MARIRTIKPEFWTDGKIIGLSAYARLFFIGCWNFTRCDRGHLDDDVMSLKFKILPADKVNPEELMEELMDVGLIDRYESNGRKFLHIRRFIDHQKIDERWKTKCVYCAIHDESQKINHFDSCKPTETHPNSPKLAETHPRMGLDGIGLDNTPPTPHGGSEKCFEKFWNAYPKKKSKGQAEKAWLALKPTEQLVVEILQGIERAKTSEQWRKDAGQFIPHPASWLRAKGWQDEDSNKSTLRGCAHTNLTEIRKGDELWRECPDCKKTSFLTKLKKQNERFVSA